MTLSRVVSRPATLALVLAGLALVLVASAAAAAADALPLLLLGLVGLAAAAAAMREPLILLYLYCAAIPFNFALPPGPGGTVARIAGLIFVGGYLLRQPGALRFNSMPATGWLFIAWTLASLLWAINVEFGLPSWLSVAQLFGATLLIASIVAVRPATVRPALWAYSLSAMGTSLVGALAFVGGETITAGGRATAFAGQDPALFSSILVPAVVHLMGEVQAAANRRLVRSAALGALVVCAGALALSGTRSAWIGLAVGIAVWVALRRDRNQLIALGGVAIAVVALVLTVPGFSEFLDDRTAHITTGSGRTDIWLVGLGILASTPVLGVGFGNFGESFTTYAISQTAGASAAAGALSAGRDAHNTFLGMTVETGIVGGLIFLAFLATPLLRRDQDAIETVLRVALVSLLVQAFFLDLIYQKQLWLFLGFAFGLMASAPARAPIRPDARSEPAPVPTDLAKERRTAAWRGT